MSTHRQVEAARQVSVAGTYRLPYVVKAERASYLVFLAILGPLLVIGAVAAYYNTSTWPIPVIVLILLGAIWLLIGSGTITLLEDRIAFRTLTTRSEMPYAEIEKADVRYRKAGRGFFPALSLRGRTAGKEIFINVKPFSKRDLAIVGDVLSAKAAQAERSDAIGVVWPQ